MLFHKSSIKHKSGSTFLGTLVAFNNSSIVKEIDPNGSGRAVVPCRWAGCSQAWDLDVPGRLLAVLESVNRFGLFGLFCLFVCLNQSVFVCGVMFESPDTQNYKHHPQGALNQYPLAPISCRRGGISLHRKWERRASPPRVRGLFELAICWSDPGEKTCSL